MTSGRSHKDPARPERVSAATLGWLRKNEVSALDRNEYRSTKVSAGAKKIAKALESHSGCDNSKSAYAYVGRVAQHEGVTEGKGRGN